MKIFDSNNSSSSEIMWETKVEFGNSHVMWIAGDLKSTIGGPVAAWPGAGGLYSYSSSPWANTPKIGFFVPCRGTSAIIYF